MRNFHKPKRQNMEGNRFSNFLKFENKLVKELDFSLIKDIEQARGRFDMNHMISSINEKGERVWTF
jgi:hypothetical protein